MKVFNRSINTTARSCFVVIVALIMLGCHSETGGPEAGGDETSPETGAWVCFNLDEAGGFFDLPFPFDYRRTDEGKLDLSGFPNPRRSLLVDYYLSVFAEVDGFSINGAIYVRFSDLIDEASLPESPAATLEAASPVFLVNVDPLSPEHGRRHPLRLRYYRSSAAFYDAHLLAALPIYGLGLREDTLYAFVVTRALRDHQGRALSVSPDFRKIVTDDPEMGEAHQTAREVLRPLFDFLDDTREAGTDVPPDLDDLAVASVFRTRRVTGELAAVDRYLSEVYEMPPPENLALIDGIGCEHCTMMEGTFFLPEFQEGRKPYWTGGGFAFDEAGTPVVQEVAEARFALSVPSGPMPDSGWPVLLYGHGTGGSYIAFIYKQVHERLGAAGVAVLCTDEPLHGPRGPEPGIPPSSITFTFFNFLNPTAGINNIRQSVADKMALVKLARQFDVPASASPTGERIRLDASRLAYMGHSLGGVTGGVFMGAEPEVGAAVLSGAGGGLSLLFLDLPDELDPFMKVALRAIGFARGEILDDFHPITTLMQTFSEPGDPISYGHYYSENPPAGMPKNIFLPEGMEDNRVAPKLHEALAVSIGLPQTHPVYEQVDGLVLKGLDPVGLPLEGNIDFQGTRSTGALIQYSPGDHWIIFSTEEHEMQYVNFLVSYYETGLARIEPVGGR